MHLPTSLSRAALFIVLPIVLAGCSGGSDTPAKVEPKVTPPAIAKAGVLRAGVDLDYPPFGGVDKGKEAGIDVDVARALAASLGLELELVSVVPSEAASALNSKKADVVLSVPFTRDAIVGSSIAGSYIVDGPAFFTTAEATVTIDTIGERSIGVQTGSEASWILEDALGEGSTERYATLREALQALAAGKIKIVAGDAIVGAYIARDLTAVRFSGQLGTALPLGVAVAKENTALADGVRTALDNLAASGALKSIRRTWIADTPELVVSQQD